MNPLESSFNYDRPVRDESTREALQTPYINGRKNVNYINPTYQSTSIFNSNLEAQRTEALSRGRGRNLERAASQNNMRSASMANFSTVEPVTDRPQTTHNKRVEINESICNPVELRPSQSVKNINTAPNETRESRRTSDIAPAGIIRNRDNSRVHSITPRNENIQELNVCDGCVNWQLAEETKERNLSSRRANLELENKILERNSAAQRIQKEIEERHRGQVVDTSRANFDTFKEKAQRKASRERGEEDVELKVNTDKTVAAESLRSLQRYQSMLDKMYETSVKKIGERKAELKKSQSHNKDMISRNIETTTPKGSVRQSDFHHQGNKSLLDAMYEASSSLTKSQANERRRASEYNYQTSERRERSRMYSPAGPIQDPFKPNTEALEESGVGNSVLDKMFYNSMDYWRKAKTGTFESSRSNREVSAGRRARAKEGHDFVNEEWSGYKRGWKEDGNSMLDSVYTSDQKGLSYRKYINQECSSYNRESGFSPEKQQLKNLEFYYKSPTKKVNDRDAHDYDHWTRKEAGVFAKIEAATDRLERDRRDQYATLGGSIKQQMADNTAQKTYEIAQNKNFKETPLLVCAHKNNVMYCNVCNRKVPMNKISKIVGEYQKLMRGRGRK